jgi:hypothetical protein
METKAEAWLKMIARGARVAATVHTLHLRRRVD